MRSRSGRRSAPTTVLALATAGGLLALAPAPPAVASAGPPVAPVPAQLTDDDARSGAVAAVVHDDSGRPTFVEVVAPTVAQALRRAASVPGADAVAVDTPMTALGAVDPLRSRQWSLDALQVDRLPVPARRAAHLVAVVDTGVRAGHEDFAPGQVRCDLGADFTGERPGGNGCTDPQGHGTHVAGIIGAVTGNGRGVASIAPGTALLPVRVLDSTGSGGSLAVARGIVHAADRGAAVINLSLGGPGRSTALDAAVQYATDKGALVVVAAGNNRMTGNEVNYPAASPGALSVASTDASGVSSAFSYRGPSVDLAAPGGRILSTWGTSSNAYVTASGTSMAAPAVSAVASLYRAAHPTATPAQMTSALVRTARDLEAPGRDHATGAGLVDPAVLLGAAPVPAPRASVVTPSVPLGQAVGLALSGYRPGSAVSVRETLTVVTRVPVRRGGRTPYLSPWTLRRTTTTVPLGTFRIAADGRLDVRVRPVQRRGAATLVVRGLDRVGKAVELRTAVRVV